MSHTDNLVVDLDGTLVLGNSFHEFLILGWVHGTGRFRANVILSLAARILSNRVDKRWRMKRRLINEFRKMDQQIQSVVTTEMLARLACMTSPAVLSEIRRAQDCSMPVILATAAPSFYAEPFARTLQMSHCLATTSPHGEMFGERKAQAIRSLLLKMGPDKSESYITVITDHRDDLPMMRMGTRVIFQGTSDELRIIANELAPLASPITHIDIFSGESVGGYWLWFDDLPSGPYDIWEIRTILSKHRYALAYTGSGRWVRARPGPSLNLLVGSESCPPPPALKTRIVTILFRRIVRDRLRIFH